MQLKVNDNANCRLTKASQVVLRLMSCSGVIKTRVQRRARQ